ncbi:MAG: hypothetical protein WCY05_07680 [Candidatus Omnitrophota bacterium]
MDNNTHKVVVLRTDLGHKRYLIKVVDVDTGEILVSHYGADSTELFYGDCNATIRELLISKDIYPNGAQKIHVKSPDGLTYFEKFLTPEESFINNNTEDGAESKGRGRTRGKQKRVSVEEKTIQDFKGKLSDSNIGFLFRLSCLARHDTGLIAKRGKPLNQKEISVAMESSLKKVNTNINVLKNVGAITEQDEQYYLNRKYISKR